MSGGKRADGTLLKELFHATTSELEHNNYVCSCLVAPAVIEPGLCFKFHLDLGQRKPTAVYTEGSSTKNVRSKDEIPDIHTENVQMSKGPFT